MKSYLISVFFNEEQIAEIEIPESEPYSTVIDTIEGQIWDHWAEYYGLAMMYESRAEFRTECEIITYDADSEVFAATVTLD